MNGNSCPLTRIIIYLKRIAYKKSFKIKMLKAGFKE